MITKFIQEEICYTGRELRSHFAFRRFDLLGDSLVSFVGPCEVAPDSMADLADLKSGSGIRSPRMLHLIAEHFGCDLGTAILRQRLLMVLIAESLNRRMQEGTVERRGDDLYVGSGKLSVSIAAQSPVSCLIHAGLNVETRGTPVPAEGLQRLGVDPAALAREVMERYVRELREIEAARCKVRGIS